MPEYDRLAARYPAVAFDVFDTLLHRDVAAPTDLFCWMESHGQVPAGFAQNRIAAEAQARAACTPREVTLAEIYARPELAGLTPDAELAAENTLCRADAAMQAFYRRCRERGQKVYAVSDMYLPAGEITRLLARCGYPDWDGVFVSCEFGVQKRSGKLFTVFLQKTGMKAGQVLFFGDDRRADQLGAALAGIRCVHTAGRPLLPRYLPEHGSSAQKTMYAWLSNRAVEITDPQERFGFSVLGPLAVSFCRVASAEGRRSARRPAGFSGTGYVPDAAGGPSGRRPGHSLSAGFQAKPDAGAAHASMTPPVLELLADTLPRQVLSTAEILHFCGFAPGTRLPGWADTQSFDLRTRPAVSTAAKLPAGSSVRSAAPRRGSRCGNPPRRCALIWLVMS